MPSVGFEPAIPPIDRLQTYGLDLTATDIGLAVYIFLLYIEVGSSVQIVNIYFRYISHIRKCLLFSGIISNFLSIPVQVERKQICCKTRNNGTDEAFPHSAVNQMGIHAQERHILCANCDVVRGGLAYHTVIACRHCYERGMERSIAKRGK
jgi:hypothetical protein